MKCETVMGVAASAEIAGGSQINQAIEVARESCERAIPEVSYRWLKVNVP